MRPLTVYDEVPDLKKFLGDKYDEYMQYCVYKTAPPVKSVLDTNLNWSIMPSGGVVWSNLHQQWVSKMLSYGEPAKLHDIDKMYKDISENGPGIVRICGEGWKRCKVIREFELGGRQCSFVRLEDRGVSSLNIVPIDNCSGYALTTYDIKKPIKEYMNWFEYQMCFEESLTETIESKKDVNIW